MNAARIQTVADARTFVDDLTPEVRALLRAALDGAAMEQAAARVTPSGVLAGDAPVPRLALRLREVGEALGVSARKVYEMTDRGDIPFVRIDSMRVVRVEALREYLELRQQRIGVTARPRSAGTRRAS